MTVKSILGVLGGVLVLVAVSIGGWYLHWHLAQANANRQSHLNRSQFGYQQTLREQITNNIATISGIDVQVTEADANTAAALKAQEAAITQMICQEATQVSGDPLPLNQSQFVQTHCPGGN